MTSPTIDTITLAGGCFWCLEAVYEQVDGVTAVESGYANGHVTKPSYEQVCRGDTGHAEVVRVSFDTSRIGLREILEIFFSIHDPTTPNRQGNDVGPQYRSIILTHSDEQERVAKEIIAELTAEKAFDAPIVTEVGPLTTFYAAEGYHQNYYRDHRMQPYCVFVVSPKVAKFRKKFAERVKRSAEA